MPVVSGDGKRWNLVVVLPGKRIPYRHMIGMKTVTIHDFLPRGSYVYNRETPGVDTKICIDWSKNFVEETKELRSELGCIVRRWMGT